jgi:cytochrome o ubiquinol oxidase subunit 3
MQENTSNKIIFGFWVYLMSDCVLFASLFASYAVFQGASFGSPSIAALTELPFVLWETLILLTSSFTVGLAVYFANKAEKSRRSGPLGMSIPTFFALFATLGLGAAFLSMELYEFNHLIAEGHGPWANASYSAFFTLVGTHGLHVFLGSVWGLLLVVQALRWGLSNTVVRRLTLFSLFWHFLDVVWIFIFTFVYLLGSLS